MSGVISDNTVRSSGVVAPLTSATLDASNPAIDTNPTDGVGTKWINTTSGQIFICIDATAGANEWIGQVNKNIGSWGIFCGGQTAGAGTQVNTIDYITIPTTGDATDFGDLTSVSGGGAACSNGINSRAVIGIGHNGTTYSNSMDYVTIGSPGNAVDFGDMVIARGGGVAGCSNGTNERGIFAGGISNDDEIDYITISSAGNATDFGNLTQGRYGVSGTDNGTDDRGVFFGGWLSATTDRIDYITISSAGNATDFGNILTGGYSTAACSNDTNDRGVCAGLNPDGTYLNTIQYITITSPGNSTDFGDLSAARAYAAGLSNGTGERGCWGGGVNTSSTRLDIIEYITINSTGNTTDFGDLTQARSGLSGASNGAS
jgi:hypothetical protein